jgi:SAM-dependent methyltransferase
MLIQGLKRYVREQLYNPGFAGLWLNPFYHARRELFRTVKRLAPQLGGRILDVGCGSKPYAVLFSADDYIGLDIDTPENRAHGYAEFFYDGKLFPFPDQSFDSLVCNQVLEHVFTPDLFLGEISRVLKPGGKLLLTVPFVWDEHEQPWDYARYTSFGLKSLLEKNGLDVLEQHKLNADIRVLFQLINAYLYKVLRTRYTVLNVLFWIVIMAPFNILGALLYRLLPANPDLYLDQVVLARKSV